MKATIQSGLHNVLALLAVCFIAQSTVGQTPFTYQGRLQMDGQPVTDLCEFRFSLFDAASDGSQLGDAITQSINVENGLFTTELDFGEALTTGSVSPERWLEVEVRCDLGSFELLTPRQPLLPSPFASQALGPWKINGPNIYFPGGGIRVGNAGFGGMTSSFVGNDNQTALYVSAGRDGDGIQVTGALIGVEAFGAEFGLLGTGPVGVEGVPSTNTGVGVRGNGGNIVNAVGVHAIANAGTALLADGTVAVDANGQVQVVHSINNGENSFLNNSMFILNPNLSGPDLLGLVASNVQNPATNVNFITFYDATFGDTLGAVQGNGAGGVTLAGPGNDYAEWLPKLDPNEPIEAGDVVAVIGGHITKDTSRAAHIMVVSTAPIIAGNRPHEENDDGEITDHALIAFIGQAPVKTVGPVTAGDLLVASGQDDGTAVAVAPNTITVDQLDRVLGTAWETNHSEGVKHVNAAIGVTQTVTVATVAKRLTDDTASLRAQVEELERLVRALTRREDGSEQ